MQRFTLSKIFPDCKITSLISEANKDMEDDVRKIEANEDDIYARKKLQEENDQVARILRPYATFLVMYPGIVLGITILIVILSAVLGLVQSSGAKDYPDFSEPDKGFEARGTILSARLKSFGNIGKEQTLGNLNYNTTNALDQVKTLKRRKRNELSDNQGIRSRSKRSTDDLNNLILDQNWLQYWAVDNPFLLVYQQEDDGNLMEVNRLKSICRIYDEKIKTSPEYASLGTTNVHHIPNYIALYNNKTACAQITKNDVDKFMDLVKICLPYYVNNKLKECMENFNEDKCKSIINNTKCTEQLGTYSQYLPVLLYNTFHYFGDKNFINDPSILKLTTSISTVYADDDLLTDFYKSSLNDLAATKINDVEIVAFKLGNVKFNLFQSEIILQSLLIITAIVLVVVFIWIYSSSLFVGLMTLVCIIFALVISYFVYGRIFDMDFFPFLNMVTLIFIVGIGADDAFVYTGIWEEAKHVYKIDHAQNHTEYLIKWTIHSLRHAVLAMLVTSLTTAAAFYANISSDITSVKCFGLYAGTSIIVNYLLMITLFPVVVILHDKHLAGCMHWCCPTTCKQRPIMEEEDISESKLMKAQDFVTTYADLFFTKYLPNVLYKLRFLWIVFLMGLGIAGAVVTFGEPGLNLPSSKDFQMFTSSNPLEQYSLKFKKEFFFPENVDSERPVSIIFGVDPEDNGNHFNPDDHGTLKLGSVVKIENEQEWLLKFCMDVKNESFYISSEACTSIEAVFTSLQSPCVGANNRPGCCNRAIPLKPEKDFLKCFYELLILRDPPKYPASHPLFDRSSNLRVFALTINTNYRWTEENQYNDKMYKELNGWFDKQKSTLKEPSMKNAWWYAELVFYDLQISLFEGTKQSLGIAIGVAFIVILVTTLNILLSLYSILTIFFILSVTIGILVLSGWDLNIMESVVFSVAAGLSADFTLHYSVAYRTSLLTNDRVARTKSSLSHIGAAILMGAFTTFIAGLVMVPAKVLVYFQMAQFLMLTMVVSWLYSTFFFLPLCMVIGPTGNFGQLTCGKVRKAKQSIRKMSSRRKGEQLKMESVEANGESEVNSPEHVYKNEFQ